jgi:hypothetical protein
MIPPNSYIDLLLCERHIVYLFQSSAVASRLPVTALCAAANLSVNPELLIGEAANLHCGENVGNAFPNEAGDGGG